MRVYNNKINQLNNPKCFINKMNMQMNKFTLKLIN